MFKPTKKINKWQVREHHPDDLKAAKKGAAGGKPEKRFALCDPDGRIVIDNLTLDIAIKIASEDKRFLNKPKPSKSKLKYGARCGFYGKL